MSDGIGYQFDYFEQNYQGNTYAEDFAFVFYTCILGPIFSWNGRSWEFDSPYTENKINEYLTTYIDVINQTPFLDWLGIHLIDIHVEYTEATLFQFSLTFDALGTIKGETIGDRLEYGYGAYTSQQRVYMERQLQTIQMSDADKEKLITQAWTDTFNILANLRFTIEGS